MTRKFLNGVAGAILSVSVAHSAVAEDYAQLVGSARIDATEASMLSLDEIAARKFSGEGHDNAQAASSIAAKSTVHSRRTGRATALDALHVALINSGSSGENRQILVERSPSPANPAARAQVARSAGLASDIEGVSLDEIAAVKFAREIDRQN